MGYIHDGYIGGIKGARWARETYRNKYHRMPPISRRKHVTTLSKYQHSTRNKRLSIATKRRKVNSGPMSSRRMSSIRGVARSTTRSVASKTLSRKGQFKKRKGVKVTRQFRAKVNKALAVKEVSGFYQETLTKRMSTPVDCGQSVDYVVDYSNLNYQMFDYQSVLNAASVLWNNKTPIAPFSRAMTDAGNFDKNNIKIHVKKSWATTRMINNSSRRKNLKVYEFASKGQSTLDPLAYWQQNIVENVSHDVARTNYAVTELFATPSMCPNFNQQFKVSCKEYILEAGQSVIHNTQGPTDTIYDFEKNQVPGSITVLGDLQVSKMNRWLIFVHYNDIVGTTFAEFGRYTAAVSFNPHGLICETTFYYSMTMPEQTGFTYNNPVVPGSVDTLDKRKHTYFIKNWFTAQSASVIEHVDVLNPIADVTNTDG